ncbi:MAG: PIN domain-containing protein [Deltaproteobacteria bacterium]|nr:PIN domain-containing protein [Deltaproteobacteria bacterium]
MNPDRIFLDANILFSVAYGSLGLERLWELDKEGHCVLFASRYVIEEAKRNHTKPDELNKLEACLSNVQIVLEADPSIDCPIDLPEKDQPVLMAAISARADYLLTGDIEHFGKYFGQTVMGVKISMARDYLLSKMKP